MNDQLRAQIRRNLNQKESDELLNIWIKHDENEWSDLAFDAIREILQDRQIELPPQAKKEHWVQIDSEGKWLSNLNIEDLEKYRPALEKDYQLLAIAKENGDRRKEGEYNLSLGSTFTNMTLFGHAIKHFEQALVIFREVVDRNQEASALAHLGRIHFFFAAKTTIKFYEQSLNIYREIGNRDGEASQLENLGLFFSSFTNETEKSIDYFNQALAIYRELGNRSEEARMLNLLGVDYLKLMQLEQAIHCNEQILLIAREISDQHKEANAYQTLGAICFRQSQKERALEYFTQALTIYQEIGERDKEARNLGNIGTVYFSLRQLDKAIECIQKQVDIFEEIGFYGLDDAKKTLADYQKIANKKWWELWL